MTRWLLAVVVVVSGSACFRNVRPDGDKQEVQFEPVVITGDLELEKLNDEELFAAGTTFYAAAQQLDEQARRPNGDAATAQQRATENYTQAARYFGRIADFFPKSQHRKN